MNWLYVKQFSRQEGYCTIFWDMPWNKKKNTFGIQTMYPFDQGITNAILCGQMTEYSYMYLKGLKLMFSKNSDESNQSNNYYNILREKYQKPNYLEILRNHQKQRRFDN